MESMNGTGELRLL